MSSPDYAERNREAWNQVAPIHRQQRGTDLREAIQLSSFCAITDIEKALFEKIGFAGKNVAQLCCNNGQELISVVKLGAASGVGFDIADEFIKEAQELAELARVDCRFVRTNITEIPEPYFDQFDIVYMSAGTLTWIENLQPFFSMANRLTKEGGHLVMYEIHPFLDMLALPDDAEYDPRHELQIAYSCFKNDPYVDEHGLDYIGGTQYEAKTTYSFPHNLSQILSSISANAFAILDVKEHGHDISGEFKYLEKYQKLPMSYTLVATKISGLPVW
jgi:ubiquinone/menaquinone biosynthesis C-methylase UbiE